MRKLFCLLFAGSILCLNIVCRSTSGPKEDPKYQGGIPTDPKKLKEYINALVLFETPNPSDWQIAKKRLEKFRYLMSSYEKSLLVKSLQSQEARKELARRGRILKLVGEFAKFKTSTWDAAREQLLALGDDAKALLVNTLFLALMQESRRHLWRSIRRQLYILKAVKATIRAAKSLADMAPPKVTHWMNRARLTQVLMLAIELKQNEFFVELSKSENKNVRKSIAYAAALKQVHLSILRKYLLKDRCGRLFRLHLQR